MRQYVLNKQSTFYVYLAKINVYSCSSNLKIASSANYIQMQQCSKNKFILLSVSKLLFWIWIDRIAVTFKYFESQKYWVVEIEEKVRLAIYGKNQLWKNWYLNSLKGIFVTGICDSIVFASAQCVSKKVDFLI